MALPFAVRKIATWRSMVPWSLAVAAFLTALWVVPWGIPDLQLTAGAPAPTHVRRLPRTTVVPADIAQRTDLDAWRGESVDATAHADLLRWQEDRLEAAPIEVPAAYVLFAGMLILLSFYLKRFGRGLVRFRRTHAVAMVLFLLQAALFKAYLLYLPWTPYFFPMAATGYAMAYHLGRRAGVSLLFASSIIAAAMTGWDLVFLIVTVAQGLIVGLMLPNRRRRSRQLAAIGAVAAIVSVALLLAASAATSRTDLGEAWLYVPQMNPGIGAFAGALLSGVLAWMLVVPVGWLLGVISRGRLIDLQDIQHPLLKWMRDHAPGSWEHSRSMANLAEAAAAAIGADALLVRVGAYFHDVGKSVHPEYFIENTRAEPGQEMPNPHEGLDPKDSADRIVEHVVAGVERLRQHGIPEAVIDFAYMHHGRSLIEYFWGKAQAEGNPHGYREGDFQYPGMRPQTRETGILMIVDAAEAASRTIQPPTRDKFRAAVERIVMSKLSQGQLDDTDLSLVDIHTIMDILVDALVHSHHERVQYPWQKAEAKEGGDAGPGSSSPSPPPPGAA